MKIDIDRCCLDIVNITIYCCQFLDTVEIGRYYRISCKKKVSFHSIMSVAILILLSWAIYGKHKKGWIFKYNLTNFDQSFSLITIWLEQTSYFDPISYQKLLIVRLSPSSNSNSVWGWVSINFNFNTHPRKSKIRILRRAHP